MCVAADRRTTLSEHTITCARHTCATACCDTVVDDYYLCTVSAQFSLVCPQALALSPLTPEATADGHKIRAEIALLKTHLKTHVLFLRHREATAQAQAQAHTRAQRMSRSPDFGGGPPGVCRR